MSRTRKGKAAAGVDTSTIAVKKAYDYLHEKTIDFGFRPGERINEVELAGVLGMSRAPVREALNRLVMGGFVVFEPGKGFFCRKFSVTEISDLYGVRAELEVAAARQVCQIATDEDIARILEGWQQVASKPELTYNDLILADEKFHLSLAALAGNAERIRILENINERIRFVRKINIESEARRHSFVIEHTKIVKALSKRDTDKLVELMDEHFGLNSKELKSNIHEGLARIYAEEVL